MREDAFAIMPLAVGKLEQITAFERRFTVTEAAGDEAAEVVALRHFILTERLVRGREWRLCGVAASPPADRADS